MSVPSYDPPDINGRYVLGKHWAKFDGLPNKWIMVHVKVANEAEATLTLHHDDL
jgi:hypothetical protein